MTVPVGISPHILSLAERVLENGGFADRKGGSYRPDATAWAILAISAVGGRKKIVDSARSRLAQSQSADGRVSVSPEHPAAFWPTSLAIMAWHGSPSYAEQRARAIRFLISVTGYHVPKEPGSAVAHDPSLHGWPWVENTHSMVEPTALSLLALTTAGYGALARAREAARMLMDRQLPKGGWNYGNTKVYGHELSPQADNTGLALSGLAGRVPVSEVETSLDYLKSEVTRLRTPLSLGWALLGLGAWGYRPRDARGWVLESLDRQERYGPYDTANLSLLLLAYTARGRLKSVIGQMNGSDH